MRNKELWDFQLWYNEGTETLYETRPCQGKMIMYAPFYGGMFIIQDMINNPVNNWIYIGDV